MRMIDVDEAYKVLTDYYHQKTEIQHSALRDALERVPTVDVDSLNAAHEDIGYEKGYRDGYAEALEVIDNAEPIKHGHWIYEDIDYPIADAYYRCSECRFIVGFDINNYCPSCGAKMDGVEK